MRKPYGEFAQRLRDLCKTQGSVAAVAQSLNMNRQQFARYVSGDGLPSAPVLRKICEYFGVAESDLLAGPLRPRQEMPPGFEKLISVLQDLRRMNVSAQQELKPGLYYNYFAVGGDPALLLRALTEVSLNNEVLTFSRFTRALNRQTVGIVAIGKHHGYVIPSQQDFTFIGRNRLAPFQMSHLVLDRFEVMSGIRFGLALTRSTISPIASRTALEAIDSSVSKKQALQQLGVLRIDERSIPAVIATAINPSDELEGSLYTPRVELTGSHRTSKYNL
jgi:transcriptional regulator with XRE-family HTH domain